MRRKGKVEKQGGERGGKEGEESRKRNQQEVADEEEEEKGGGREKKGVWEGKEEEHTEQLIKDSSVFIRQINCNL